jgi:hypothetical protein
VRKKQKRILKIVLCRKPQSSQIVRIGGSYKLSFYMRALSSG